MESPSAWLNVLIGAGAFILGVITTIGAMRRRDRESMKSCIKEEMEEHVNAEHTKDSEGRTLRERLGIAETNIKSLQKHVYRGGPR